jgi:hypothetical protein
MIAAPEIVKFGHTHIAPEVLDRGVEFMIQHPNRIRELLGWTADYLDAHAFGDRAMVARAHQARIAQAAGVYPIVSTDSEDGSDDAE